ncbi:MAG: threonine/serine dehydratase [Candidatus Thorarchaeota archaeon]|nr:threonine/serine dehydratase [Candidatus Thorarchaeota archaeon]
MVSTGDSSVVSLRDIEQARERIKDYIKLTPVHRSQYLSELIGGSVHLKLENVQVTGSFKVRGALNRLMTLGKDEVAKGVITASTGNHGLGTAFAASQLGISAAVVFPTEASEVKLKKMLDAGVQVIQDVDYAHIETRARKLAAERSLTYVSPYSDPMIIAGAGTSGLELTEQLDSIDSVIVPIGGGGLISGIAIAIKAAKPNTEVIGVQSEVSPEVYESWKAGHWVDSKESDSLAQGLMGGVEPDSITLDIIQEKVDRVVLVKEESILNAMRVLYQQEQLLVEGAGATSTAFILEKSSEFMGKHVVAVVSGGNITKDELESILIKHSE